MLCIPLLQGTGFTLTLDACRSRFRECWCWNTDFWAANECGKKTCQFNGNQTLKIWTVCGDRSVLTDSRCMYMDGDVSSMQTCKFQPLQYMFVLVESNELPCACGCKCCMWTESPTPASEALGARCQLFQTRSSCCSVNSVMTSGIRGLLTLYESAHPPLDISCETLSSIHHHMLWWIKASNSELTLASLLSLFFFFSFLFVAWCSSLGSVRRLCL